MASGKGPPTTPDPPPVRRRTLSLSTVSRTISQVDQRPVLTAFILFALLTIIMTWPLPRYAGSAVQDLGDPMHEMWTMRWVQHQLPRDPGSLWDGNMGYPFPMSLLFSEPRLSTSLISWPLYIVTGNEVLAYNLMFLLTFVTTGAGMALLVREITASTGAGLLAGIFAAFTPYRYGHLSHLNLLSYGWLLLGLWAMVRFSRSRQDRYAILAAVLFVFQFLASDTLALMSLPLIGATILVLLWQHRRHIEWRLVATLVAVPAVAILAMTPVVLGRLRVNDYYGFTRDLAQVRDMSATPRYYWSVSSVNHFWSDLLPIAYPNPLFPGAVAVLGMLLGAVLIWKFRAAWGVALIAIGFAAGILSLGPDATFAGRVITLPYSWLYHHAPGMSTMRDVARFGFIAIVAGQIFAGIGFAAAWLELRHRVPGIYRSLIGAGIVLLLATLALVEFRSDVGAVPVDRSPERMAAYQWLAEQPRGAVFEIPADGLLRDVLVATQQIYYSTHHWQPIVAAYTSFVPEAHIEFLVRFHGDQGQPSHISWANVGMIQDLGIDYVVIHHEDSYDWQYALDQASQVPALERVGVMGNATVYRLNRGVRQPIDVHIETPSQFFAGQSAAAALVAANPNTTAGIMMLQSARIATVAWTDEEQNIVLETSSYTRVPILSDDGIHAHPIVFDVPPRAGRYTLTISFGEGGPAASTTVDVQDAWSQSSSDAQVELVDVTAQIEHVPGEILRVTADWVVQQPLDDDVALTVQLLDAERQVVAQFDRRPFPGIYRVARLEPGDTFRTVTGVHLPDDLKPGPYSVLVALYREAQPGAPRLTIQLPDGATATELIHDDVPSIR